MEQKEISKIKRLVIDLPQEQHQEIHLRAVQRNISIKSWVLRAIREKIKSESQYE